MNWNAVGAIGQILGSLAVFVTIGFLAVQVRDSEKESQLAMQRARQDRGQQFTELATDQRLADIHVKVNMALGGMDAGFFGDASKQLGLTYAEAYSLFLEQLARWNTMAYTIIDLELDDRARAEVDRSIRFSFTEPAFRFWYERVKSNLNPDAVHYVDKLLAQPNSTTKQP